MRATESLIAFGHKNLKGTHKTTLEITKVADVTANGDCIVGVNANKSLCDLDKSLKAIITHPLSKVILTLEVNEIVNEIEGFGDPRLPLTSREDIVCRKSSFISERTLMVRADKAAADIDRRIIQALKDPKKEIYVTIQAEC